MPQVRTGPRVIRGGPHVRQERNAKEVRAVRERSQERGGSGRGVSEGVGGVGDGESWALGWGVR